MHAAHIIGTQHRNLDPQNTCGALANIDRNLCKHHPSTGLERAIVVGIGVVLLESGSAQPSFPCDCDLWVHDPCNQLEAFRGR